MSERREAPQARGALLLAEARTSERHDAARARQRKGLNHLVVLPVHDAHVHKRKGGERCEDARRETRERERRGDLLGPSAVPCRRAS